jgi:hypothetical protein
MGPKTKVSVLDLDIKDVCEDLFENKFYASKTRKLLRMRWLNDGNLKRRRSEIRFKACK